MRIFGNDRGVAAFASRMSDQYSAARRGLAGDGDIGVVDHGPIRRETDDASDAEDAHTRLFGLYACAQGTGAVVRQRGDRHDHAATSATGPPTKAFGSGERFGTGYFGQY